MNDIALFQKKLNINTAITEFKKHEQVECPLTHHFADGQYIRECFLPKGTIAIGKQHKNGILNILMKGTIVLYMGEDQPVRELTAPCIFPTEAGSQKIVYAKEDVIFANTIPTHHTNLERIEQDAIINEYEVWLPGSDNRDNTEEHP